MSERMVKCQDTGEQKPKSQAWQGPNKKYYSSQKAWDIIQKQKKYKEECIDYLMEIMGYKPGMKLPTMAYKKIEEYREPYGFDVLLETMQQQIDKVGWALKNKNFQSETAKVMYLFAIFQNNAMDAWKSKVAKERAAKQEKNIEIVSEVDISTNNKKTKTDVSKLLGDDDLWT